jgi:hypothetical protein
MPRIVTTAYSDFINQPATSPIFLIEIKHDGSTTEKFITSDVESVSGYGPGASITKLNDNTAEITLPATPDRIAEVVAGDWRQGPCTIWARGEQSADQFTILSGTIDSSRYIGGAILVTVMTGTLLGQFTPVYTYDAYAHYMPADGEVMDWDGDLVVAQSHPASYYFSSTQAGFWGNSEDRNLTFSAPNTERRLVFGGGSSSPPADTPTERRLVFGGGY